MRHQKTDKGHNYAAKHNKGKTVAMSVTVFWNKFTLCQEKFMKGSYKLKDDGNNK